MSDPFDRDKPLSLFDRLRIHEHTAEDRDVLLAELEEEYEALKERHEVLQALLRGRLSGDEDVPAPMKAGDRIPPSVAFVLDLVADLVDSVPEAENYVQLAWTNDATGMGYELTVRYADGEMPATRAERLEKELSDLKEEAASEAADYEARLAAGPVWNTGNPERDLWDHGNAFSVLVFDPDEETFHVVQHDEDVPGYFVDHEVTPVAWGSRWIWTALPSMEVTDVE